MNGQTNSFTQKILNRSRLNNELWNDIYVSYRCESNIDKFIAVLLALLLLFSHFKGLFGLPLSSVVLLSISPYILLGLFKRKIYIDKSCIVLIVFMLYKTLMHNIDASEMIYSFITIIYVLSALNGRINIRVYIKTIFAVSIINTIILFFQTITHYLLGIHINFIPMPLLLDEIKNQVGGSYLTAISERGGFYRPSGIFDEPAHFTLFVAPLVIYLLFSPNTNFHKLKAALFISVGVLLTTSGMGIAFVLASWVGYYFLKMFKSNPNSLLRGLAGILVFGAIFYFLFQKVEIFKELVLRIFGLSSMTSYSAIDGRTKMGKMMVSSLTPGQFLWGTGEVPRSGEVYYTGMHTIILSYGVIGFVFYELIHVILFFSSKEEFKWLTLFAALILVISDTYSIQYRLYYFIIMFSGSFIVSQRNMT